MYMHKRRYKDENVNTTEPTKITKQYQNIHTHNKYY